VVDYQVANRAGSLTFIGTDYFNGWPIYVTDRDLSKHGVAVGTTGAGKTEYGLTIIESAIRAGHPVIYVDGKGDLKIAARIRAFAEKQQRKFYLFNADNVAQSDVYKERSVYPGPQAGHLLSMGRSSGIQVLNLAQSFSIFGLPRRMLKRRSSKPSRPRTPWCASSSIATLTPSELPVGRFGHEEAVHGPDCLSDADRSIIVAAVYELSYHPEVIRNLEVGTAIVIDKNRRKVRKLVIRRSQL
jgi:hypothetical protein